MIRITPLWLLSLALIWLLVVGPQTAQARQTIENGVKYAVYLSPEIPMEPGLVSNKFFYDMEFPRGHIAISSFNAELVDDAGKSVPLYETYLHHWSVARYYIRQGVELPKQNADLDLIQPSHSDSDSIIVVGNSGLCKNDTDIFGAGSESRKRDTYIPHPYGIEVGNPDKVPQGYEEQWRLNTHIIDTRGAEDKLGCIECRLDSYNVTMDKYGRPFDPNYVGGSLCCYDKTQCKLKKGFKSMRRSLYLRYTVKWVDWDKSINIPVNLYVYDVTDPWKKSDGSKDHDKCTIEYVVESCPSGTAKDQCVYTKRVILSAPSSGDLICGDGHQHTGGIGIALYGEDGRVLCSSVPIYGDGNEAGNEADYVVGMTACYPQPGTVKILKGETIVVESNYSSSQRHTGVMGAIYILVAETPSATGLDSLSSASAQAIHKYKEGGIQTIGDVSL